MTKNLILVALSVFSLSSFGALVKSAELDAESKNILVTVVHGGGCGTHKYTLKMQGCFETFPVSCTAKLVHVSNDFCEAILSRTAVFSLKQYGLDDSYYKGGTLTIQGSYDSATRKDSSVSVQLP